MSQRGSVHLARRGRAGCDHAEGYMELDHIFVLTTADTPELTALLALGLVPTYRREHRGQGTANVCFCFDNAFLELLWVTSPHETESPSVARMQLGRRGAWRQTGASPFGLAWRVDPGANPGIATWSCAPPYLPAGVAIEVAEDSDDVRQPLMFSFPGARAPREWPSARRGTLQQGAGYERLEVTSLALTRGCVPSPSLRRLAAAIGMSVETSATPTTEIELRLHGHAEVPERRLRFPGPTLVNSSR